jgi:hypothetical protein
MEKQKSFEDLLLEASPERYRKLQERLRNEQVKAFRAAQAKRKYTPKASGPEMDSVYRLYANALTAKLRAEEAIERWWNELKSRSVSARPWTN